LASPSGEGIDANGKVATSFTTGADATSLSSVTMAFEHNGFPTAFSLQLYSNGPYEGGSPDTLVETLTGSATPGVGNYSYVSGAHTALAPNTTYWLVSSNSGTGGAGVATASSATPTQETSSYGWSIGNSLVYKLEYPDEFYDHFEASFTPPQLFAVYATSTSPIPEPSTYAMIAGAGTLGVAVWRRRRRGAVEVVAQS